MTDQRITATDIIEWNSLQNVADSLTKRGLKPRPDLGAHNELVLEVADEEFIGLVEAKPNETPEDYLPEDLSRHTNVVASNEFEEFTFISRIRSWEEVKHGDIQYRQLTFTKENFRKGWEQEDAVLQQLNSIEYQSSTPVFESLKAHSGRLVRYVRNIV